MRTGLQSIWFASFSRFAAITGLSSIQHLRRRSNSQVRDLKVMEEGCVQPKVPRAFSVAGFTGIGRAWYNKQECQIRSIF